MQESKHKNLPEGPTRSLGTLIRQAREAKGMSLRQLADALYLHYSYVSRLERDAFRKPSPEVLQRIATLLDIDRDDLFALAGYLAPEHLPRFHPYLRAKYRMDDHVAQRLCDYFDRLKKEHGIVERSAADERDVLPRQDMQPESVTWEEL